MSVYVLTYHFIYTIKAEFNPFGTRKRSYNFKYPKNTTAIEEVVEELKRMFHGDKMIDHLR